MTTESPIFNNHLEMASEIARPNPWAFDSGSGPDQPSTTSQPAKRSPCPSKSTRPFSGWLSVLRTHDTVYFSPHTQMTPTAPSFSKVTLTSSLSPAPALHASSRHPILTALPNPDKTVNSPCQCCISLWDIYHISRKNWIILHSWCN